MNDRREHFRLILASSSPRRRELLERAGYRYRAVDPPIVEPAELGGRLSPSQQAEALAYFKARSVWSDAAEADVLGADTIVAVDGEVLGKPKDRLDAQRMLQALSGTRHEVITGVALLGRDGRRCVASVRTYITMHPMSEREIKGYLDSGEWVGKAGGYAIQETADRFVQKVEGSFTNVVGLPMEFIGQLLPAPPSEEQDDEDS